MLILYSAIILFSVVLDQITKYVALKQLKPILSHEFIPGLIEFHFHTNDGIAWGMLGGMRWVFIPISIIAILVVMFLLFRYRKKFSSLLGISLSMIVGGGIGNQIDRIVYGEVVDFLNFQFIDFPIFNVADCFVTIGAALALISILIIDKELLSDDLKDNGKKAENKEND